MDEVYEFIALAVNEYKKEFGQDVKIEEGDEFVTVFNNCVLILGLKDGTLQVNFIGGKPYYVDASFSLFEGSEIDE